jgi:hypothetical protein
MMLDVGVVVAIFVDVDAVDDACDDRDEDD